MEPTVQKMSFVVACKKFFGMDRGSVKQNLQEFGAELKALTPQDRVEMSAMFKEQGYEITDVPQPTTN